jgi:hypothetical protein
MEREHQAADRDPTENGAGTLTYDVAYAPGGQVIATVNGNGQVALLRIPSRYTERTFATQICRELRGDLTKAAWSAYAPGQPYQKTCPAHY